jgi:UDP-glucose 4-epimerase
VSLRYFNVAGATERRGEVHSPETHLVPRILLAAEGRVDLTIYGNDYPTRDGTNIRDYIHVSDLADAHLLALEATDPGDPRTGGTEGPARALALNLGNGDGFSVLEVLAAAERAVGRPIPHAFGPRRPGDPPILVASAAQAAEMLDWRPRRPSLEQMIGSAWSWRSRNPDGYAD